MSRRTILALVLVVVAIYATGAVLVMYTDLDSYLSAPMTGPRPCPPQQPCPTCATQQQQAPQATQAPQQQPQQQPGLSRRDVARARFDEALTELLASGGALLNSRPDGPLGMEDEERGWRPFLAAEMDFRFARKLELAPLAAAAAFTNEAAVRAGVAALGGGVAALDCRLLVQRSYASAAPETYTVVVPEPLPRWVASQTEVQRPRAVEPETAEQRAQAFARIKEHQLWGEEAPVSGSGSLPGWPTANAIDTVVAVVDFVRAQEGLRRLTLVDVPCGDMSWMPLVLQRRQSIQYVGLDIVPSLIDAHRAALGRLGTFAVADVVVDGLPKGIHGADVVFTRHMLQHLSHADALATLRHFKASGAKYLLTTTFPGWQASVDLPTGSEERVRKLNLQFPPFNFPPPLCWSQDHLASFLALWDLRAVSL